MVKKYLKLTESDLREIIKESVKRIICENSDTNRLIKEVLFNGCSYDINNADGYEIGVGYGRGTKKEFYYPYSERLEHSYCHVTVDDINAVVKELEDEGYEFEHNGNFVSIKGEGGGFHGEFKPSKPSLKNKDSLPNANTDPVGYYSDNLFTKSKDGNLGLF